MDGKRAPERMICGKLAQEDAEETEGGFSLLGELCSLMQSHSFT